MLLWIYTHRIGRSTCPYLQGKDMRGKKCDILKAASLSLSGAGSKADLKPVGIIIQPRTSFQLSSTLVPSLPCVPARARVRTSHTHTATSSVMCPRRTSRRATLPHREQWTGVQTLRVRVYDIIPVLSLDLMNNLTELKVASKLDHLIERYKATYVYTIYSKLLETTIYGSIKGN